ncbi:MAG: hypothetical protein V1900_03520 [Candidatus Aenigmatarchaeota archaeon]
MAYRYYGLHPWSYLLLGIISIPLILIIFSLYFSTVILISWLVGISHGIAVNEVWFSFMDKNFGAWKKSILRREYHKLFRRMEPLLISYFLVAVTAYLIFFEFGLLPYVCIILGICLTGLFYYREQGEFYRKLMKK